jgi:hypothetical protein
MRRRLNAAMWRGKLAATAWPTAGWVIGFAFSRHSSRVTALPATALPNPVRGSHCAIWGIDDPQHLSGLATSHVIAGRCGKFPEGASGPE